MNANVPANITPTQPATYTLAIMDPVQFEHMQRVGKMLALSPLFPEHLRKGNLETAIANGVLVLNMAMRLREDPLTVAQNIYFVGGKPGWMTTYLIAKANQHGVFEGPIDWKVEGKGQGENLSVTAYATLARSGRIVSVTCDMALAKAEGWTSNKKYQTMPEQMLRYRSATWMIRLYCPEVLVGVPALIDNEMPMRDVTPEEVMRSSTVRSDPATDHDPETGEMVEGDNGGEKQIAETKAKAEPEQERKPAPKAEVAEAKQEATQTTKSAPTEAQVSSAKNLAEFDAIMQDAMDAGSVERALADHAAGIDAMLREDPALHKRLMAELDAWATSDPTQEQGQMNV